MTKAEPDAALESLERICRSEEFAGSKSLQALLTYVVQEELAGRGEKIRAKTIGLDVHKYSPDQIADREGVVRVDAGRVRRKLEDYYGRAGADETVRISLPIGTYRPSMVLAQTNAREHRKQRPPLRMAIWLGASALATLTGFAIYRFSDTQGPSGQLEAGVETDRREVFDISPARVEAANLADVGRDLIFPAVDRSRLLLALQVFEAAIEKDETYYGGYAGAAQVHASLALISPDEAAASKSLAQAEQFSRQALSLRPDAAWALSATSWAQFAHGNIEEATDLSHRALDSAPLDPHVAEFDALISLYTSDFQRIFDQEAQREISSNSGPSYVFQNVIGSAKFHTGDYQGAIETFENAIASGAPFGPISVTYLMVSYHMIDDETEAARLAMLLAQRWPEARVERLKRRLFTETQPVDQLIEAMQAMERRN